MTTHKDGPPLVTNGTFGNRVVRPLDRVIEVVSVSQSSEQTKRLRDLRTFANLANVVARGEHALTPRPGAPPPSLALTSRRSVLSRACLPSHVHVLVVVVVGPRRCLVCVLRILVGACVSWVGRFLVGAFGSLVGRILVGAFGSLVGARRSLVVKRVEIHRPFHSFRLVCNIIIFCVASA